MGRKAKYQTNAEKQAAKHEQRKKYAQSEQGRLRKSVQNKRAYAARTERNPSPFRGALSGIPCDVVEIARQPCYISIPNGSEVMDDLGLWTSPYTIEVPVAYDNAARSEMDELFGPDILDLQGFQRALNGHQFARLRKSGMERLWNWVDSEDKMSIVVYWTSELDRRLRAWESMKTTVERAEGPESMREIVLTVGREWAAKVICTLKVELDWMLECADQYDRKYDDGMMPWQCMNVEVE
ncbi:uncharacterized protein B0H18DRAFT_1035523 [Fomitopsis serialis]|uniref:uncharacterized protein n=1 Tax=Fomitopsis serialis TaxID=139415 RepID=UPI0020085B9E|nr:uncharacterized protein B0H18DRAFT_1035523 [Neoantrodia serialis]KAH9917220.1 hypothetical protein B0H18DRAFT_1035523 [Neoantrodia serialis]